SVGRVFESLTPHQEISKAGQRKLTGLFRLRRFPAVVHLRRLASRCAPLAVRERTHLPHRFR
ncbi:hypothetical protein, partial [Burkholderia cepacia]|uniref:hypothetical protein n=1 Tax=Burkholderia cepacia TaxID=292 RepID=UPI0019552F33